MRTSPISFTVLLLLPTIALADGMVIYHSEVGDAETIQIEAEAQRAALWYRDGTWELTIQPVFPRGKGGAAWIVPLPVVPEVAEASPDFLDMLEVLTAPVFIPYCVEKAGGGGGFFGCAANSAGVDGGGRPGDGESGVVLWEEGETDALEWVVLEAPGAAPLLEWLDQEGYRVPSFLEDAPELLDGQVVFAAKLKPDLKPNTPLPPMTFRLQGVPYDEISYPLRLTAAVAPEAGTELILWLITPKGDLAPADIHWLVHQPGEVDGAQWELDAATLREAFPPEGGLVLEYNGIPSDGPLYDHGFLSPPGPGWNEVLPQEIGLDIPFSSSPEVTDLAGHRVARFRGRLTAAAMAEDLSFEIASETQLPEVDNVIWNKVPCSQIGGGTETADARSPFHAWAGAAVLALVTMLSLGLLRRTPC